MVIISCSDCEYIIEIKQGFDCNTENMVCPECGCDKQDVEIGANEDE